MDILENLEQTEQFLDDLVTPLKTSDKNCPVCQISTSDAKLCPPHLELKERIREAKRQWQLKNNERLSEKENKRRELKKQGWDKPQIEQELFKAGLRKQEPKTDLNNSIAVEKNRDFFTEKHGFRADLDCLECDNKDNTIKEKDKLIEQLQAENEKQKKQLEKLLHFCDLSDKKHPKSECLQLKNNILQRRNVEIVRERILLIVENNIFKNKDTRKDLVEKVAFLEVQLNDKEKIKQLFSEKARERDKYYRDGLFTSSGVEELEKEITEEDTS